MSRRKTMWVVLAVALRGAVGGRRADGVRERVDDRLVVELRDGRRRRSPSASSCRSPATARSGARRSWPASRWRPSTSTPRGESRPATTPTSSRSRPTTTSGIRPSPRPSRARPCRTACATSCRGRAQRSWPRTPPNGARPSSRSSPPPTRYARAPSTRTTTTAGSTTPTTCRSCTRTPRRPTPTSTRSCRS